MHFSKKKKKFLPSPPDVAHLPPNVLITPFRLYFFLGESVGGEKLINNLDAKEKKTLFSAVEKHFKIVSRLTTTIFKCKKNFCGFLWYLINIFI